MSTDHLFETLKRLILEEKKDLTSDEVIEVSSQLDKTIIDEMKLINRKRLRTTNKNNFIRFRTKRR